MEEELLLKQPVDRRLVDLPPGPVDLPPGVEDYETKKSEKEGSSKKSSRRSPTPKRKSPSNSRSRRSPSPPPRRNRYRYSPDRRASRFDRRRSPPPPPRDRYRGRGGNRRGQSSSRSRSRSVSPANRRSARSRWSPKKKPNSPPPPQPPPQMPPMINNNPQMMINTAQPPPTGQFGVPMQAPPPPQMYGGEAYAGYGQTYQGFSQQQDAYAGNYNAGYTTQNTWGTQDAYNQQAWMQAAVPNPNQPTQLTNTNNFSNTVNQTMAMPSTAADATAAHDAAVAQEAENQREELKKQRSSYINKNSLLKKELKMLRDQRKDLDSGTAPPSPTTKGFIDENEKLQNQIIKKIATIDNVIEMLTGVIGEEHVEQMSTGSFDDVTQKNVMGMKTAEISKNDPRLANMKAKQQQQQQQQQHQQVQQKGNTSTSSNSSNEGSHSSDSSSSSTSDSSSSSENEDTVKKADNKTGEIKQNDDDDDSSPERLKHKVMESMKSKQRTLSASALKEYPSLTEKVKMEKSAMEMNQPRFNYAFYDPEMHWCQKCNVFPKTAKDYLNHLHSKDHMEKENATETPWHANIVDDNFPVYENVQTKRMPIRGITFFAPATAWFCKLCSVWMGDLHCASVHLKSRQHSNKYTAFLERNPNFEMNWLADRQRVLNEKNLEAAASQITAVSTTAAEERENKKNKKNDEKSMKKHKKNSDKKDKKKKKKRNKKRKKAAHGTSSDTSDSDSTSSDDAEEKQSKRKKKLLKLMSPIKDLDNPNPAASIRLAMRKGENNQIIIDNEKTPPPPAISMTINSNNNTTKRPLSNWTVAQEGVGKLPNQEISKTENKTDDSIIQQWNSVQPVISDNEKKLLEQLKGKLKTTTTTATIKSSGSSGARDAKDGKESEKFDSNKIRNSRMERNRRERDTSIDRFRGRRSRTRSPTRSRSRGRDWRRARSRSLRRRSRSRGRRSRSRSRGRYSPIRGGRRRYSRSRSRGKRRSRSRSRNRRGRRTRSRTRSGSRSGRGSPSAALTSASRIEKPVIPHSEFRPRVPEKDKDKEKKSNDTKDKKDVKKPVKTPTTTTTTGKKLPFIGKMPVFKKQTTGQTEGEITDSNLVAAGTTTGVAVTTSTVTTADASNVYMGQSGAPGGLQRSLVPTAEQIKMAMMEDVYGNAPPFHPDAGVMHTGMDYEDLMPDPVQFVNLMSQAPPAPPPPIEEENVDDDDVLPPGIDENEMENEEFVAKPAPADDDAALPKDFEEALNIIFPGERKSEDENDEAGKEPSGETQIIVQQPVMQMDELYKEGIHLVSIEETSLMAMDEASQLSMNEPLVFNNVTKNTNANKNNITNETENDDKSKHMSKDIVKPTEQDKIVEEENKIVEKSKTVITVTAGAAANAADILKPNNGNSDSEKSIRPSTPTVADNIPMPPSTETEEKNNSINTGLNLDDLADIPHPPAPLTESEKQRRQEELDDLAMLGIDADDMAAQCM